MSALLEEYLEKDGILGRDADLKKIMDYIRSIFDAHFATITAANSDITPDEQRAHINNFINTFLSTRAQISGDAKKHDELVKAFLSPEDYENYKQLIGTLPEISNPPVSMDTYGFTTAPYGGEHTTLVEAWQQKLNAAGFEIMKDALSSIPVNANIVEVKRNLPPETNMGGQVSNVYTVGEPNYNSATTVPGKQTGGLGTEVSFPVPPLTPSVSYSGPVSYGGPVSSAVATTADAGVSSGLMLVRPTAETFDKVKEVISTAIEKGWIVPAKSGKTDLGRALQNAIIPLHKYLSSQPVLHQNLVSLLIEQFAHFITRGPVIKSTNAEMWKVGMEGALNIIGSPPKISDFTKHFPTITPVSIPTPSAAPTPSPPIKGKYTLDEELDAVDAVKAEFTYADFVDNRKALKERLQDEEAKNLIYEIDANYTSLPPDDQVEVDGEVEKKMKQLYEASTADLVSLKLDELHAEKVREYPALVMRATIEGESKAQQTYAELLAQALNAASDYNMKQAAAVEEFYAKKLKEFEDKVEAAKIKNIGIPITVAEFGGLIEGIQRGTTRIVRTVLAQEEMTVGEEWANFFIGNPKSFPYLRIDTEDTAGRKCSALFDLRNNADLNVLKSFAVDFSCRVYVNNAGLCAPMVRDFLLTLNEVDFISILALGIISENIHNPGQAALIATKNRISQIIIDDNLDYYLNYTYHVAEDAYRYISDTADINMLAESRHAIDSFAVIKAEHSAVVLPDTEKIEVIERLINATEQFNPPSLTTQSARHFVESASALLNTTKNVVVGVASMADTTINTAQKATEWFSINWHLSIWGMLGAVGGIGYLGVKMGNAKFGCSDFCGMSGIIRGSCGFLGYSTIGGLIGTLTGITFDKANEGNPLAISALVVALSSVVGYTYLKNFKEKGLPTVKRRRAEPPALPEEAPSALPVLAESRAPVSAIADAAAQPRLPQRFPALANAAVAPQPVAAEDNTETLRKIKNDEDLTAPDLKKLTEADLRSLKYEHSDKLRKLLTVGRSMITQEQRGFISHLLGLTRQRASSQTRGGYRMTGKNKRKTGKQQNKRQSRKRISRRKHRKV
jgi:hypothetical protein